MSRQGIELAFIRFQVLQIFPEFEKIFIKIEMSMQVVVLCPDGHRVTVKVTKQTPLLSILEEACTKRKLDPTQHALRKENDRPHVPNLDTSLTMKFAGIERY